MTLRSCTLLLFRVSMEFPQLLFFEILSLRSCFNALLDSGCTHHPFNDRSIFTNFNSARQLSIGTANCGSMKSLGSGNVTFNYTFAGHAIWFTLHDCLYAPDVPIGLISVGALQEKGLQIVFESSKPVATMSFSEQSSCSPWLHLNRGDGELALVHEPGFHISHYLYFNCCDASYPCWADHFSTYRAHPGTLALSFWTLGT